MAVSIQVVNPAHHDANKKCTSATCCAPSKIWKAIQTIIATDDKAALEKLFQNKNRAAHVKDVILASRLPNDASRYPPSHKHRILQFNKDIRFEASAKFGKSVTDLNALQVALLHSKEDMAMQILIFMRQHAEPGELRLFIHHVWGARNTSLHLAGFLGMPRLARTLLELGADPSATNARNLTAADCTKDAETLAILATHASKPTAAVAMSNSTKTRHQLDFLKKAPMAIEPGTTLCPPSDDAVPPPLDGNNSASDTDDASEDGTQQVLPWGAPALSAYYSASVDGHRKAFNPFNLPWLSAHPESQDCIGADNDGWGQHPAKISPYVLQASEELVPQETITEYKEAQDKSETSITDHCVLSPPTAKQQHQDYQHLAVAKQDCMDAAKTAAPFKRCDAQDHGIKKAFDVDCFDLLRVKCDKHRSSSALECLFAACCSNHGTDCLDWLSDGGKSPSALDQLFAINCSQDWLSMVDDYGKSASLLGNLVGTDDQGIDDWLDNVDGWCILALERCSGKWKHDSFRDDASLLRDKHDWLDSGDLERLFTDWRDPAKSVCWYDWLDDFADRNNSPGILGCLFDNPQGINNFKDTDCEFGSPHDRDPGRRIFASSIWKHHAQDKAEPSDNGWCSLDPSLQGHSNMQDGSSGDPGKWKHSSSLTDSPGDTFSCSHDSPWKNSNPSRFSNKNNQWRDYSASESRGLSPCATAAIAGVHHRQGYQPPGHVYQQEGDSRLHHRGFLKQVKLPWVLSSSDTNSDKHGWGNPPPVNKTAWNRSALYDHCDARHGSAAVTDTIGLDRHLSRSPDDNKTRLLLLHQLCGHILETWWKTHHPTTTLGDPYTNDWVWHHDCRHDAFNVKNPIQDGGNVFSGSTSQVAVF